MYKTESKNQVIQIYLQLDDDGGYVMDLDELGIAEFNEIKQKLECNDQKIERLLEKTKLKYPQIESDKGALYLLAKDRNINFDYDNKGNLIGSRVDSNNFEVDVQNFLDRDI